MSNPITNSFSVNGRSFHLPVCPRVATCLDGSANEYFDLALHELGAPASLPACRGCGLEVRRQGCRRSQYGQWFTCKTRKQLESGVAVGDLSRPNLQKKARVTD